MAIALGTRLGPYEIISALGAGGMGEVYRARDTKLNRDVAIKVLLASVASDPDRLARFSREAQVLASLNHPNIAHIHGLEETDPSTSSGQGGVTALILELVEGEDLAQRIARGPVPLDEALPIARQIAEALEAAHEHGIIHRDLKPANIKVRPDGTVKVLDFGLAKAMDQGSGSGDRGSGHLANSPTITSPAMMTGVGVILGTAVYMSPEQAKGRPADKRSDVWAFGCVLYEMLTGRRAFDGDDMTDVLGAVVRLEPHWDALAPDVPQPIRKLLNGCLIKNHRHRVADISTALFVIDNTATLAGSHSTPAVAVPPPTSLRQRLLTRLITALVAAVVAGTAVWFVARPPTPTAPQISRLLITTPESPELTTAGNLAMSPDGSRVVYVGNRGTQLLVRPLDALEPTIVSSGSALRAPFVSPDSEWIGFMDGGVLKKVAITGGPTVTVGTLGGAARGATWGPDDTIIAATSAGETGLLRLVAGGAAPTILTRPDRALGEADHVWPEALPDGRGVLFTILARTGGLDAAQVAVFDLRTGTHSVLLRGGRHARFLPGGHGLPKPGENSNGYLVYTSAGAIHAVRFDPSNLKTLGTAVAVVPDVSGNQFGAVDAVVARNGTLAYLRGGDGYAGRPRNLVWVDRQGRESPIAAEPRAYVYPRLSPDGTRIAVSSIDQEVDIWIWELGRSTLTRATFDAAIDHAPMWTPDGRLIFSSERLGARNLFWQRGDGPGSADRLSESPNRQSPTSVTPDGRHAIVTETGTQQTLEDVIQVELFGTHRVTALLRSPFSERNGVVSPNGRWLAYEANDAGRYEVSVRPFPDVNSGRSQISTAGGTRPLWSRNGKELFYISLAGALMRVGIEDGPGSATVPTQLIGGGYLTAPPIDVGRSYDISPDGQRFLMIKGAAGAGQPAASNSIIVVQHWVEDLKRLLPSK